VHARLPAAVSPRFVVVSLLHIAVDVCGIPEEQLSLIVRKIRQAPCIVNAYWHRLD
jgi:hypothetical protein